MKKIIGIVLLSLVVSGCNGLLPPPPPPFEPQYEFNVGDIEWSIGEGSRTLEGQALLRQVGGGVVTCAGTDTFLIPVSEYATELITFVYGNPTSGFSRTGRNNRYNKPIPDEYYEYIRIATCDAQGNFTFNELPSGKYFVVSTVNWRTANRNNGGFLMQRVDLMDDDINIILTIN